MACAEKIYRAVAYYRLSREDGYNNESDSIGNQKKFIYEYISRQDYIELVGEEQDDGYTGTNYDRPGFSAIMKRVEAGEANCVIVKDLSRLGREYIETGKYLEMIFPALGVRFIAINDDVDSENRSQSDDILIPVRNIMNESYCRELSKKLRRQFVIQRRNGEFLGAFASYGYWKSPDDKHKLIVDEYAAEIVRGIFAAKIQGYSIGAIANTLNNTGILPPAEYKRAQGLNYKTGLQSSQIPKWHPVSVRNILTNRLYIGELIQGKRGTPNYKVKKMRERKTADWTVVQDNHEPLVESGAFAIVQQMLERDTRTSPTEQVVAPLAGLLFCADCGRGMCRRTVTRSGKKFLYYVCSTYKRGSGCSNHSFGQERLETVVLHAMQNQIQLIIELDHLLQELGQDNLFEIKSKRLDEQIAQKQSEIDSHREFRLRLLETLNENLIDRNEYNQMRGKYGDKIASAQAALSVLLTQKDQLSIDNDAGQKWMVPLLRYKTMETLSREAAVSLINRIVVHENKHIHIEFNFQDEIALCQEMLPEVQQEVNTIG